MNDLRRLLVADHLQIRIDALPCAAFFVPSAERSDRVVLRLASYLPRRDVTYQDLSVALRGMIQAARDSAGTQAADRLVTLREALIRARKISFPEATSASGVAEMRANLTAGASVIGALAAAAKLFVGA